jgi:dipeptidyl aminopeptidase/acylaminoacyl peptidase
MKNTFILILLLFSLRISAQDDTGYKLPPKELADMLLASPSPYVTVSGKGDWMVLRQVNLYPSVEYLAQPELRIAGLRINPNNFSRSRQYLIDGLSLENVKTGTVYKIDGLPSPLHASQVSFSPSEKKIAFINITAGRVDLYIADVATHKAVKINKSPLNTVLSGSYWWFDDQTIFYKIPLNPVGAAPKKSLIPAGPSVQESIGKKAPSRTFEDLIKTPYDESLFAFYTTVQLIKNQNGIEIPVGKPAIYTDVDLSPDKKYILQRIVHKPFSYLIPAYGFNSTVVVTNANGQFVARIAELPSEETSPSGFDNVQDVPHHFSWRHDQPSTLIWFKPLDSGFIKHTMEYHDACYSLSAPFTEKGNEIFKTKMRVQDVTWGNENLALVTEGLEGKQLTQTSLFNPSNGQIDVLYARNTKDEYNNPGDPVLVKNKFDKNVVEIIDNGSGLLMNNEVGGSPKGDLPFLAKFDLKTKKNNIVWRCGEGSLEYVVKVLDADHLTILTSRQTEKEVANYYVKNVLQGMTDRPLTHFPNPYPQLEGITKEMITYKRADGVSLTGTLYLPKGYDSKRDGPLPVFMMAYPVEYNSSADAGQVRGTKYSFPFLYWGSPIFWVTQGYAILDDAEMPIVAADSTKKPNDDFVNQLTMNAEAAIHKLAEMGVGDSTRVAVGGHSYGAFMTVNLLAHTDMFKAGIARSGAYNRSLTPFGFQLEDRTYWENPKLYFDMSPFSYADKIKTPLLLIHGEMDDNQGTFPIQSERMYNAIKGNGGTVRYVVLPYEAHGYRGKENLLHMLYEENKWLDKYVKNAKNNL